MMSERNNINKINNNKKTIKVNLNITILDHDDCQNLPNVVTIVTLKMCA